MNRPLKKLLLLVGMVSITSPLALAGPTTYSINFEQFPEYTQITNQYAASDAIFTNSLQLVAPDYDYFDFPPHSGSGVITNDPWDPIQVNFAVTVNTVSGWYADPDGVTVTAYDSSNLALAVFNGAPVDGSDLEFTISSPSSISYITISDDYGYPDSEIVDDLSYTTTPEPESLILLGTGALGLVGFMRRRFVR